MIVLVEEPETQWQPEPSSTSVTLLVSGRMKRIRHPGFEESHA